MVGDDGTDICDDGVDTDGFTGGHIGDGDGEGEGRIVAKAASRSLRCSDTLDLEALEVRTGGTEVIENGDTSPPTAGKRRVLRNSMG